MTDEAPFSLTATAAGLYGDHVWIVTGTRCSDPYPCRCHESKFGRCHPAFCPCSGRIDPAGPECCATVNTPARAAQASADYALKKARERGILG